MHDYLDSRQTIGLLCSHFPDVLLLQELQNNLEVDPLHITRWWDFECNTGVSICVSAQSGKSCVVNFHSISKQVSVYSKGLLLHKFKFDESAQYEGLKSSFGSFSLRNYPHPLKS
jgi:hypothetical protein